MPGAVAPAASCARNAHCNAHEFSAGTTEHTPASPAQWFTAYTCSPRCTAIRCTHLCCRDDRKLIPWWVSLLRRAASCRWKLGWDGLVIVAWKKGGLVA